MSFEIESAVSSVVAVAAAHAAATDRGEFPSQVIKALGETGLLGLISATEVGGQGQGLTAAAYLVERLARECASSAMITCMHFCATVVIEQHGPLEVRRAIAAGTHLSTAAFSEVGSRSHFSAPLSTARADGANVRLNARKSFVTSAHHADSYMWSSKPLEGSEASTLWLVPRNTPGIRHTEASFDGLGLRGNDSCSLTAEDAAIPASARLGADGAGLGLMMGVVLPWFAVLASAVSLGLMEASVQKTIAHATGSTFEHVGSTIADLPTVRAFIARMRIATDMTKTLLADTVAAITSNRPDAMLRVMECKAAAGESSAQVTELAMRVCGGAAFRKDVGVERVFRDARAAQVMAPTTDLLYDMIGKAVCGMPLA